MYAKKNKGLFSKIIVAVVILLNVIFSGVVLYIFFKTSAEPTTLIVSWFAFTTGELSLSAFIKTKKRKDKEDG